MFIAKNFIIFISIIVIIVLFINYPIIIIAILCLFFITEFSLFSYIYSAVNKNLEKEKGN